MKTILPLSLALTLGLSASVAAQTTVLSEDFSTWPPAGWTLVNNNGAPAVGWIQDTIAGSSPRAWHEDEFISADSDNTMVSPVMDLSAMGSAYLHFDGETNWVTYLANYPGSFGNGVSTMEITTDGGLTWAVVWTDTSTVNYTPYSPIVDISAYAGMSNVQLGVHFFGNYAQEWWVDNVVIDNNPGSGASPFYSITNLTAGQTAIFQVDNATPFGVVMFGYSLTGAGPTNTQFGTVAMSAPINLLATVFADVSGTAQFPPTIPGNAAGITLYTQALDLSSGILSNSLAQVVQ